MKTLVVLPTYNEVDNINKILDAIVDYEEINVLVVDDNSTDGTKDKVNIWMQETDRVHMLERPGKLGLGTAYVDGFRWGLERGFDLFFEIDADLSHDPKEIQNFLNEIRKGADVVIGSRYVNGTISVVGWDFRRLLISKFGNFYASTLLGMKDSTDITSGYRAYTKEALEKIDLSRIESNGYSFQIEMAYYAVKAGLNVVEHPIIFYERESGGSKMSRKIVFEAVLLPFKIHLAKIFGGKGQK